MTDLPIARIISTGEAPASDLDARTVNATVSLRVAIDWLEQTVGADAALNALISNYVQLAIRTEGTERTKAALTVALSSIDAAALRVLGAAGTA